jgi:hypothetical protein
MDKERSWSHVFSEMRAVEWAGKIPAGSERKITLLQQLVGLK